MDERVTELEIKMAYQERLMETLNQVIIEQGTLLDALAKQVALLAERSERAAVPEDESEEAPPHY